MLGLINKTREAWDSWLAHSDVDAPGSCVEPSGVWNLVPQQFLGILLGPNGRRVACRSLVPRSSGCRWMNPARDMLRAAFQDILELGRCKCSAYPVCSACDRKCHDAGLPLASKEEVRMEFPRTLLEFQAQFPDEAAC